MAIDDSADTTATTATISSSGISAGLAPAAVNFSGPGSLTISGGSGGNTFIVTGTPGPTTLNTGTGGDTVDAQGTTTSNPLTIHGQGGSDIVNIGDVGLLSGISGIVSLDNVGGWTALAIDDSADASSSTSTLTATQFSGTSPAAINYANLSSLTAAFGSGADTVLVTGTPTGATTSVAMGGSTSNAVNLGDASHAASNLGDVTVTGTTGLTIDDSDDTTGQTVAVASSTLTINTAPVFTYGGATLSGLTFDAADAGSNTVDVTGTPTATNAMALAMGAGTGNSVDFGPRADAYGDVTLTTGAGGTTGLTIDDSVGNGSWTYGVTASAVSLIGGPTVTYGGATLSSLELDLNNNGGNTINVTGMPTLPPASPMVISAFAGGTNTMNLGDASHAASGLGSISIGSGSSAPYDLTIDDSADTASTATIGISSTQFSFTGGPAFDLSPATIGSLTFDASDQGSNTVNATGSPSESPGLAPITLAMGTGTGNAVNLGDATDAAADLGNVTVTTSTVGVPPVSGSTSLTIDDSDDGSGQEVGVTPTAVTIFGATDFDYTNADLTTLTFDASDANQNTVIVTGTPVTTNPLMLDMGTATGNTVDLGDASDAANGLGNVTVTTGVVGQTGVWIDDSADVSGKTIGVTGTAVGFSGGPTFNYGGASLSIVSLKASDAGSNLVTVTGTPGASNPLSLDMGTGATNAVTVGDVLSPASGLGSINFFTEFPGSTSLTVDDSGDASPQTVGIDATSLSFINGPGFVYNTAVLSGLTFDASTAGGNDITVTGSPQLVADATVINVSAPNDNPDSVMVGSEIDPASGLTGNVNVQGSGSASLTIDDSASTASASYDLTSMGFSIGETPSVSYSGLTGLTGLTIQGSSGGDTWSVTGTPTTATTNLETNPGTGKTDWMTLGNESHPASGLGAVRVHGDLSGTTSLTIDDSSDTNSTTPLLEYNSTTNLSDLTGVSAATISFDPSTVSYVTLATGSGSSNTMMVDFSQGNPVPSIFDFEGMQGVNNALILQGELPGPTPFGAEDWAYLGADAAELAFGIGSVFTTVQFSNLASITDTVPVSSYRFDAPSNAQVIHVTTGPAIGSLSTDEISSGDIPPVFTPMDFANKADVLVDLRDVTNPTYVQPPATNATGLQSLTFWYFGPDTSGQTLTINGTTPGTVNTIQLGGNGNTVLVENVTADGSLVIDDQPGAKVIPTRSTSATMAASRTSTPASPSPGLRIPPS